MLTISWLPERKLIPATETGVLDPITTAIQHVVCFSGRKPPPVGFRDRESFSLGIRGIFSGICAGGQIGKNGKCFWPNAFYRQ